MQKTLARFVSVHGDRCRLASDDADLSSLLPQLSDEVMFSSGDGSVTLRAAELPKVYKKVFQTMRVELPGEHLGLLYEGTVRERLARFLRAN